MTTFSTKNLTKNANALLTLCAGSIGLLAVWSKQVLLIIHQAPFPVSPNIDIWVDWILKVVASILGFWTLLSKANQKQTNINQEPCTNN